jgi:glutamate 5-kinase
MGLQERPATLAGLQACAAVGQSNLMARYDSLLRDFGMHVAQLLVTHEDLEQEGRMKNFRATLDSLSGFPQVLPVVNENDSVAIEELRYGDNDKLSAAIAKIWKADLLILLTSANGLMTDATQVDGQPIPLVTDLDAVLHHADSSKTSLGSGGMASKLEAVRAATHAGIDCIIANGRRAEQIPDLVRGEGMGTRFPAVASSTSCL